MLSYSFFQPAITIQCDNGNKCEQNPVAQRCLEELDGHSGKAGSAVHVEAGKGGWAQIWCTWNRMGNCMGRHFLNCKMNMNNCFMRTSFPLFFPGLPKVLLEMPNSPIRVSTKRSFKAFKTVLEPQLPILALGTPVLQG